MSRPKSSWGSILAAGGSTVTALQLRKTQQHTKRLVDLVSSKQFNEERRHKEQLLATILASKQTSELFVEKLNELNQDLTVSMNMLSAEMRDISKSNWSILDHLETRKAEREYEGKMFHLITTLMEDLEDFTLIAIEFPEYVLVRANAWDGLFNSLKFSLEKFAQMEDSRKYDRARKVFKDLENLIESLSDRTKKQDVENLDKDLAHHQMILDEVSTIQANLEAGRVLLLDYQNKSIEHQEKKPIAPELAMWDSSDLDKQFAAIEQRIEQCKEKIKHYREVPSEIEDLQIALKKMLLELTSIELGISIHLRTKPRFFQSRAKKDSWRIEYERITEESEPIKEKVDMMQNRLENLCIQNEFSYMPASIVFPRPSRKKKAKHWGTKLHEARRELKALRQDFKQHNQLENQKTIDHEQDLDLHQKESKDLKNQVEAQQKEISAQEEKIESCLAEANDLLLKQAHFLPATYIAME